MNSKKVAEPIEVNEVARCKHRHTIESHPRCFASGNVVEVEDAKYVEKVRQEAFPTGPYVRVRVSKTPFYKEPGTKIGYFDIEVTDLKADFGWMISWAIKGKDDDNVAYDEITQKELLSGKSDYRIVKSCLEEINKYNIIVTYYGTGFDIPYLRTRALFWQQKLLEEKREKLEKKNLRQLKSKLKSLGVKGYSSLKKDDLITEILWYDKEIRAFDFPEQGRIYHFDLYYVVRYRLKLNRNSLANVTRLFGIDGKTPIDSRYWVGSKYADPKAMKYVKEHNIADVVILEKLHNILNPFKKWTRRSL